jgi:hypothetical protein
MDEFGNLVGLAPLDLLPVQHRRDHEHPRLRYEIVIAQAIPVFSFGLNQWLRYHAAGGWTDHAYGEQTYLVLSLVARSLLAWEICAGSLAPERTC